MLQWHEYSADWPDLPYRNFIELVDDIEKKFGEKPAILYRQGKQKDFSRWSFNFFATECRRIAGGLLKAGLKKGDRVALWAENRPEWMAVWIGAVIAGCTIVPIDYLVSDKECNNIVDFTGAKAFFYSKRKEEFVKTLCLHADLIICIDDDESSFKHFGEDNSIDIPRADSIAEDDCASIIFTSGTTGFAKGVMLSHKAILANISAAILALQPVTNDLFINVLPLHHTYPTTCSFLPPLITGTGVIIVEKLVGKVVIDDIRDAGGTFLIAVPLLYDKVKDALEAGIKKLPGPLKLIINALRSIALKEAHKSRIRFGQVMLKFIRKKAGLGSIRLMVSGGGPLNPVTADFFESLGFNIFNGYGMSENAPLISVGTPGFKNNHSVGLPVKYTEVKIIDPDEEGIGEIVIKSPSIMLGYYNNPEATAETITRDGWLLTGDLGYRDEKGFIFINGRKKNLIVSSGGKNIYPEEIEIQFNNSRVIGEILVMGRRESVQGGEQIIAVTVPNYDMIKEDHPGRENDEAFIKSLIKKTIEETNRNLPSYKKISDFILRQEPFEKNAQQKIRRFMYKEYGNP